MCVQIRSTSGPTKASKNLQQNNNHLLEVLELHIAFPLHLPSALVHFFLCKQVNPCCRVPTLQWVFSPKKLPDFSRNVSFFQVIPCKDRSGCHSQQYNTWPVSIVPIFAEFGHNFEIPGCCIGISQTPWKLQVMLTIDATALWWFPNFWSIAAQKKSLIVRKA